MALGEKDLGRIGEYVESRLPQWIENVSRESAQNWLFGADRALFMALNAAIQLMKLFARRPPLGRLPAKL